MPPIETLVLYSAILGAIVGAVGIVLTLAGRYKLQQGQRKLITNMNGLLSQIENLQKNISALKEVEKEVPDSLSKQRLEATGIEIKTHQLSASFEEINRAFAEFEKALSSVEINDSHLKAQVDDFHKRLIVVTDTLKSSLQPILDKIQRRLTN